MIDLHCHILPGIDDGPKTMQDSVALASAASAGGTRTIVATPHVSWEWPDNDSETIAAGVRGANGALRDAGIAVDVLAGAEVALSRAADLELSELRALRLGGGPWLLVECPLGPAAPGLERGLGELQMQGHGIVLAHPERCPAFHSKPQRLAALVRRGMLTSVTASSFTGRFGRGVERFAFELLRRELVHDIASDAHDAVGRPPALATELTQAGLGEHATRLAQQVPDAILRGDDVPPVPPLSRFARWTRVARWLRPAAR